MQVFNFLGVSDRWGDGQIITIINTYGRFLQSWPLPMKLILTMDFYGFMVRKHRLIVHVCIPKLGLSIILHIFILRAVSPCTTGLKALFDLSNCTSTAPLPSY